MTTFWNFLFDVLLPWLLVAEQVFAMGLLVFAHEGLIPGGAYVSPEGIARLRTELRDKQAQLDAQRGNHGL